MTRLFWILLALAACGGAANGAEHCKADAECNDSDDCTKDTCVEGVCDFDRDRTRPECNQFCNTAAECDDHNACTDDDCVASQCTHVQTCASVPVFGEIFLSFQPSGDAFVGGGFTKDASNAAFLDALLRRYDQIAQGTCAKLAGFPPPPNPRVQQFSVGNVQVRDGATTIADMAPDAQGNYNSQGAVPVALGRAYDVGLTGTADVPATTFLGGLKLPSVVPSFTDTGAGGQVLITSPTIRFAPVTADQVILRIQFQQGGQLQEIACNVGSGASSVTVDDASYALVPPSGSVLLEAIGRTTPSFTAAGEEGAVWVHSSIATSRGFEKSPALTSSRR